MPVDGSARSGAVKELPTVCYVDHEVVSSRPLQSLMYLKVQHQNYSSNCHDTVMSEKQLSRLYCASQGPTAVYYSLFFNVISHS